jgi:hypothetical protein
MATMSEKEGIVVPDTDVQISKKSLDDGSDSASNKSIKESKEVPPAGYPSGFKLFVLTAATLSATFLMSIDQVSSPSTPICRSADPSRRPSSVQQSQKSQLNSTDWMMWPGTQPHTS